MNRSRLLGVVAGLAIAALSTYAYAAGMFSTLPLVGGAAYCTGTVTGTGNLGGITGQGQGTLGSICGLTEPAGPSTFTGTETAPFDLLAPGTQSQGPVTSALVNVTQLDQGPMIDLTTVGTSQTIPNQTPWYFLDGAQASALTVTMPANPVEGEFQHVVCEAATVGVLTVAANTGQTLKGNPNAACVANTGYAWRYQASNATWYRIQ